jgi:hypothetical protein
MRIEAFGIGLSIVAICMAIGFSIGLVVEYFWASWFPTLAIFAAVAMLGTGMFLTGAFSFIAMVLISKGVIKIV